MCENVTTAADTASTPSKKIVRRGKRNPTAVWIESSDGERGTSYRIRWVDPLSGKVASENCGRDMAFARQARDRKKAELRDARSGRLPDRTLSELIDHVGTFMAGRSEHTIRKTRASLESLKTLCGDRLLIHVGRDMLMDFRSRRFDAEVSIATCNKDIRQIRSALSYACDAGWLKVNPLLRWRKGMLREPEKIVRVVEADEFAKLLVATPDPVFRVLLIVGYHQGMRRTELANLRWSAVDFTAGALHVVNRPDDGEFTKSRKNRTIPMHPTAQVELAKLYADAPKIVADGRVDPKFPHVFTWEGGEPFKPDWITHQFAALAKRAKVKATIHDLRRSFSTLAQRAGVDRLTVKDLGGWSSVAVVERHYTGEIKPVLQRAMDLIVQAQGVAG